MNTTNVDKPLITVFTPLYNRIDTLKRTYKSMCRQTSKNFVWMIIDDGSTDNPYEVISKWLDADNGFEIKYIYKENGGMHTAHNTAYENIDTELNLCIDSDDYMPDNAIELIEKCWIDNRDKGYAGIIALDYADSTKSVIGKELPKDVDSTTLMGYYNNGGFGDKKLIYRTDIINSTPPYPVFDNEKYVALAYKYHLIDEKYEMKILNECVCIVDYQMDGSSTNMYRQYMRNPKGFAFWRKEQMKHSVNIKQKFKACIHYVSSSLISKNKSFIKDSPEKFLTVVATPFGFILNVIIKKKSKNSYMKVEGIN
jgi:glycosyltransferase involved in cell wall biosynthesis